MLKLSVVTVCYNSAETIRETIESVISQNYDELEYIIVDGGSTDGTIDIIQEYRRHIAKFVSEPDRGMYDAMNKGIALASGDAVCHLNSDDTYSSPDALAHLVACLEGANAQAVFADLVLVDRRQPDRILRYYSSRPFTPARLRYGWMPAHPTFLVLRSQYERYGGYSLDYQIAADFEMMVRLFHVAKIKYAYLPEVVVRMKHGGKSTAGWQSSLLLNREIATACNRHGLGTNLFLVLLKVPLKLLELFRRPKPGQV